jgi:hypothetical protein
VRSIRAYFDNFRLGHPDGNPVVRIGIRIPLDDSFDLGSSGVTAYGLPTVLGLEPADPTELGPYRIAGRLGRGGMGTVYLAEGPSGPVAIKVINQGLTADPQFVARFKGKVAAARKVSRFCTVGDYLVAGIVDEDAGGAKGKPQFGVTVGKWPGATSETRAYFDDFEIGRLP